MKTYNKILTGFCSIFLALTLMLSCETIETDLTEDPNNLTPDEASIGALINSSQFGFNSFFQGLQFSLSQVTRMELMRISATYANQFTVDSFNGPWINAYANCLVELDQVKQIAATLETDDINGNNIIALAQIMEAYTIVTLVDVFGDVPYSETLQGSGNLNPKRDQGEDVYDAARDLLLDAIAKIDAGGSVDIPSDLFYDGDIQKWRALANSLLIKIAVSSRINNANAAAQANAVINSGGFISTNNDDFQFNYGIAADPESRHPLFTSQYISGASIYMSNPFIRRMEGDPRFNYYFYQQDGPGGLEGREHGDTSPSVASEFRDITIHGLYPAGGMYNDGTTGPGQATDGAQGAGASIIMTNAFTQFLIAEAQLVLNGSIGNARTALIDGVSASINKVTNFQSGAIPSGAPEPSQADIDAYIASVAARYDASGSNQERLDVIITEYYKSLWGNGVEIYNNFRRTSYPSDLAPSQDPTPGTFTNSMLYPSVYIANNNNPDAVQKQSVAEKVWWAEGTTFNLDF